MLELGKLAAVLSGVTIKEAANGRALFVRLSDLSDLKAGRLPTLARGEVPEVARAVNIESGDLIVGARGFCTDVCIANEAVFGAFVSLDLYLVRPNKAKIDPQYLFAFMTLPSTQALFALGKQGSSLARLPKDALEKIRVPLPATAVQRSIAELSVSIEVEDKLMKKLVDLKSRLGREALARAIREADTTNKRSNL